MKWAGTLLADLRTGRDGFIRVNPSRDAERGHHGETSEQTGQHETFLQMMKHETYLLGLPHFSDLLFNLLVGELVIGVVAVEAGRLIAGAVEDKHRWHA